jgi:hypothetical protein
VSKIRESFVEHFGEEQAAKLEAAAVEHKNGIHDEPGSDFFRWAIVICIGFECFTKDRYREYHGITAPVEDVKQWVREHGDIANHDGDADYLSLFCGTYNEYVERPAGEAA